MNTPILDRLLKDDFYLQSWKDRYGYGIWVCVAPEINHIDTFRNLTQMGDNDALPTVEFVQSADWLPIVSADAFSEAVARLEARLSNIQFSTALSRHSVWATAVAAVFSHIEEVNRTTPEYGLEGRFGSIPAKFADIPFPDGLILTPSALI